MSKHIVRFLGRMAVTTKKDEQAHCQIFRQNGRHYKYMGNMLSVNYIISPRLLYRCRAGHKAASHTLRYRRNAVAESWSITTNKILPPNRVFPIAIGSVIRLFVAQLVRWCAALQSAAVGGPSCAAAPVRGHTQSHSSNRWSAERSTRCSLVTRRWCLRAAAG